MAYHVHLIAVERVSSSGVWKSDNQDWLFGSCMFLGQLGYNCYIPWMGPIVKGLHAQFICLWAVDHFGNCGNLSHDHGHLGGNSASWHLLSSSFSFILALLLSPLVHPHALQNTLGGWWGVGGIQCHCFGLVTHQVSRFLSFFD